MHVLSVKYFTTLYKLFRFRRIKLGTQYDRINIEGCPRDWSFLFSFITVYLAIGTIIVEEGKLQMDESVIGLG